MKIKNAIITKVDLSIGDHGCLSCWVHVMYNKESGQGFGGINLCSLNRVAKDEIHSIAGHFICRVMQIADVTNWNDLIGKSIRVKSEAHTIAAIGNIINDDWFDIKKVYSQALHEQKVRDLCE